MVRKHWDRNELLLAINLYFKIPFGKIHNRNPQIIKLATLLNRTPSAVSWKLVNFASLDPSLKKRGIKGATHTSKLDKEVWEEFFTDWDELTFESEKLHAKLKNTTIAKLSHLKEDELPKEGKEREQLIKVRTNQSFFRSSVLSSYNNTCCITGIHQKQLLIAGHIIPWSVDQKNRMNPQNGILLNALHDKAFEEGLITITPKYKVKISTILKQQKNSEAVKNYFLKYENQSIILPSRFLPAKKFLRYHNEQKFKY